MHYLNVPLAVLAQESDSNLDESPLSKVCLLGSHLGNAPRKLLYILVSHARSGSKFE